MSKGKFIVFVIWLTVACVLISIDTANFPVGYIGLPALLILPVFRMKLKEFDTPIESKYIIILIFLPGILAAAIYFFDSAIKIDEEAYRPYICNPYVAGVLWIFNFWPGYRLYKKETKQDEVIETQGVMYRYEEP